MSLEQSYTERRILVTGCIGPISLGNNSEFTILQLAISYANSRSKLIYSPLPQDDPRRRQPDLSKAKAALNWQPVVTLDDGLKKTTAHFRRPLDLA
jgi:UDP-glucuronate decarboxylase